MKDSKRYRMTYINNLAIKICKTRNDRILECANIFLFIILFIKQIISLLSLDIIKKSKLFMP